MPAQPFPLLNLLFKGNGEAKLEGGGKPDPRVKAHQANRSSHASFLTGKADNLSNWAKRTRAEREAAGLPAISGGVPFVLEIPKGNDDMIEFLAEKLGLEIVAEYEDGFLIVASDDLDFQKLRAFALDFTNSSHGAGGMASILDIDANPLSDGRIKRILSEDLFGNWPFPDTEEFTLDVSIESTIFGFPAKRRLGRKPTPQAKQQCEEAHAAETQRLLEAWDTKRMERETEIIDFVHRNNGTICSITDDSHIVDFPDSFSVRIKMAGAGFKDLIKNYPNLFEVTLADEIQQPAGTNIASTEPAPTFTLVAPDEGSPAVCVIDSGIEEQHRWLEAAIDKASSRCFVPGKAQNDVADYVGEGGHGTSVAGACLYPIEVPKEGTFKAPFRIQNARVLDENNGMSNRVFPAELLHKIVSIYNMEKGTRIFQHSIGSKYACRLSRMSVWAATIDLLSFQHDVLFIQAAGNIRDRGLLSTRPGILDYIAQGKQYPDFLYEPASRLCNPAQSLQALTVGSISAAEFRETDIHSISKSQHPSAFSRSGFGMWDSIKPEVVEFGGDRVIDNGTPPTLTTRPETCPELIRSTRFGGPAYAKDKVGTSFSAPKVAHIAGQLAALLPEQETLLYRALIVNSARWPRWADSLAAAQRPNVMRSIGYGLPDLSRATENANNRVTLITDKTYEIRAGEGFVFGIPIPPAIRAPGESFRVRIDITLSYAAKPRRTRRSRRGYLAVWLDWKASKKQESFDTFRPRALKDVDGGDGTDDGNFRWVIGNKKERDGTTDGVARRCGTVQKDWVITSSYDLPDVFGIVVRGHPGWDRRDPNAAAKFALAVSFEIIGSDIPIFQEIQAAIQAEEQVTATQAEVVIPNQ